MSSAPLVPATLPQAREEFLVLVAAVRPDLHRYCARLTGSVIEGEDIVQDALARAFYALSLQPEVPPLRPWLFRIAHNAAMDFLKSHGHRLTQVRDDLEEMVELVDRPDPAVVRAALKSFCALPITQRSALILKDVLGHSLEEAAETMATTIMAVKAALVRGRAALKAVETKAFDSGDASRALVDRYAALFNARDWDGVRALVADDCRLDLVSRSQRRGKAVGSYFARYEKEDVTLRPVCLDGAPVLAAYVGVEAKPAYFVLVHGEDGRITSIRDFRYVPYIAAEAEAAAL